MYQIELRPPGRLHVTVAGLLSEADADRYIVELSSAADKMRKGNGHALILVDGRESPVQPAQIMAKMANIQSILIVNEKDRAAYVVRSTLGKMQAQRLSNSAQLNIFLTEQEALDWLEAP